MSCWDILEIDPTNDLILIKKAYAAKAKACHPEDDPEGFKHLRDAYKQAVRLASAGIDAQNTPDMPSPESIPISEAILTEQSVTVESLNFIEAERQFENVDNYPQAAENNQANSAAELQAKAQKWKEEQKAFDKTSNRDMGCFFCFIIILVLICLYAILTYPGPLN